MTLQITGAVQDLLMDAVKAGVDGGVIRVYASGGTPPVDAKAAVVGTLMVVISENGGGTGINFEDSSGGVISKATAETWLGTVLENSSTYGDVDYYRFSSLTDAGGVDDTEIRVQGAMGEAIGELLFADTTLVKDDEQRVDYFSYGIPGE